jgi:3-hydroxymyristoyl/3-hydroxydecanoyl-(acyl carrier protein) dehydratase
MRLMEAPVIIETVDINTILKTLPHRYPMLLIDRVVNIRSDFSGIGIKNVTINEPAFPGHFPERPVYPGVMMIEAMAQTAGVIGILAIEGTEKPRGNAWRHRRISPAAHRQAQGDVVVSRRCQGQRRDRRGSRCRRDADRLTTVRSAQSASPRFGRRAFLALFRPIGRDIRFNADGEGQQTSSACNRAGCIRT